MKNSNERRNQIVQLLQKNGAMTTQRLSELLKVTPATIRRDLDFLENVGTLTRSWGRASLTPSVNVAPPTAVREERFMDDKKRIAEFAAQFVQAGDSIILDSSTTVLAMADNLKSISPLSVVTNFIPVAYAFANSSISLQYTGGFFENDMMSLIGPDCETFFRSISVSKAFIGTTSVRASQGFAVCSPFQSQVKRCMIEAAREVYLLMDPSKVDAFGINQFANFRDIDYLITTRPLSPSLEEQMREAGMKILYADRM
ncbi:DeoR/GlpR family DNA-binding transcription regulator [Anaerolentibacter hominis]|uniref:DeoR/GlpR family DNA-binding transcription regulator n=1 Tax=Anaerolentibacter hominis TaxID=3079009 RepID=UPI0031B81FBA